MQWENLTTIDFSKAVNETGVCLLPLGVLEKHGEHLPLGTDYLIAHKVASLAAQIEPAVVFPPFYFGQVYESKCFPGTITLKPSLLVELMHNILDEIGRNGFKKIILYNGHGGNTHFLHFLCQCTLWEEKPYSVYLDVENLWGQTFGVVESPASHACEYETSLSLAVHEHLVKRDMIPPLPFDSLDRVKHLPNSFSGIHWYACYPEHYAGNANLASFEKGQKLLKIHVEALAKFIGSVKADQAVPSLNKEFFSKFRQT